MVAVRVRWWEGVLLCLPGALSVLFFVSGQVTVGVVLTALVVVLVVSRAQVVERNVAGGYATVQGWLAFVHTLALFAIYGVIVFFLFVGREDHWARDRKGSVAIWAMVGLAVYLFRDIRRLGDSASSWWLGGDMEREVARKLDILRQEGWSVAHDLKKDFGGNVDHLVTGPRGAFAIETKTGKNRAAARNQAIANAVWAKEKFGHRWVTAVLCVGTDPPPQPRKLGHVWVTGTGDLAELLRRGA